MNIINDFPWRTYTKEELMLEYNKLKKKLKKDKITFPIIYSRIGLKCSNYFFQYERLNTISQQKQSCIDFWYKNKNKIIEYSKDNKRDYFSTIVFLNHAPSQFPIYCAGQIYKYFKVSKVLDFCAGWGDRCLAAIVLGIDYIGIDSNINLEKYYNNMINFYPINSKIKLIFDKAENVNFDLFEFDLIFTSPPFWNKKKYILEQYYNCEIDYDNFLKNCLIPIILKYKNIKPVCLNIPEHMYNDILKYTGKCKEIFYFKTGTNHKNKNHSSQEYNYIYYF
jgi:DNA modification methylase